MTSLVTELLYSAGDLKKEDISTKIEKSKHSIEEIKIEVQENLKRSYVDLIPQYLQLDDLLSRLSLADEQLQSLVNHVELEVKPQMSETIAEFHETLEDLKKVKILKSAVSSLLDIHHYLDAAKLDLQNSNYLGASEKLLKVQGTFDILNRDNQKCPELYPALKRDMYSNKATVISKVDEIWNKKVCIKQTNENKKFKSQTTVTLDATSAELDSLLQSLENLGYLKGSLKKFCAKLLNLALEPVILHKTVHEVHNNEGQQMCVLSMTNALPTPNEVFSVLTEIFKFLHETLGERKTVPLQNSGSTCDCTVMRSMGSVLAKDFSNLVVEKCIKQAIPSQSQHLEEFSKTRDDAVNFHNLLLELGFFESKENVLMDFIQNVDTLPANRMAQDILSRARNYMKEDLHQMVTVGVLDDSLASLPKGAGDLNEMMKTKGLSKSSFLFPHCQISQFAKHLTKLINEVMVQAQQVSPSYAAKLYYTARNICELYCAVVPVYHKEEIESLPQQTAVHHNNCMYIANSLLTLGARYELTLPLSVPVTFVDLVPEIRKMGAEAFLAQMRRQRQQLLHSLQEEAVFQNIDCDEGVFSKAEKAVHQCLCQLGLLKKVWSDVLPVDVYFKAVGTLLNTCLEEIILNVTSMEDIAASASAQLDSVFSIILKQAPSLFTVSSVDKADHVHLYVRKWFKFQELQLVLGASMQEIVDRWSSGKGPLASHFGADEVKRLIRALFQNTERRAAALGRIH